MSSKKNILFIGQFTDVSGYGTAARSYLKSLSFLEKSGKINLSILNWSFETKSQIDKEDYKIIKKHSITESLTPRVGQYSLDELTKLKQLLEKDFEIVFFLLNDWIRFGHGYGDLVVGNRINLNLLCQKSNGVYPCVVWESDMVPKIWEDSYKTVKVKKLLCACEWNKSTFEKLGYKLEVVPYAQDFEANYDNDYYNKLSKILKDKFVFTSVFQWGSRKGIEKLIKAFQLEFVNDPNAFLVLKTYHSKPMTGQDETQTIRNDISKITNSLTHYGNKVNAKCKIVVINQMLTKRELNSLYKITDVYATTTRGEGFGLPIVESLNYNNPVIAPDIGGHLDFLSPEETFFIDSTLEPVDSFDNELWSSYEGNWVEASINSTRKQLRKCYTMNREELKAKGNNAGRFMKNYLSFETCNLIWKRVFEA